MHRTRSSCFPLSALAAVAIVACAPAMAQNTTAAVGGRITGGDGAPIAGASIDVRHVESGALSRAVTDADGRYLVRGLRVGGPYTVTFSKGSLVEQRKDVFLALADTLDLDATLGAARVEVVGRLASETFNGGNTGAGTRLGSRELNALASIQRSLQDYARVDPRLSQTDKERGEISVAGQNSRFNSITIDGVTTNDTFGLESNNLPTLKQPISIDAIQSVQVNVSNYDVTQKGYTGANINAVTKSGTNDWKGSLYYVYRDDSLAGDRYNRATDSYFAPPKLKEETKGVTLGGPIIKDKLFVFANYEELRALRAPADFGPVGDAKTNVAITPSAIASAQQVAQSKYGMNVGSFSPVSADLVVKDTLVKLDWNISDNHRASLRYAKTEQSEPVFPNLTNSALSLSSNWYSQGKAIETVVGQWFADWTPNFSTELKLSRRDYDSVPANNTTLPQVGLNFLNTLPPGVSASTPNNRTLFFGTERSRHFNQLFTSTDDLYAAGNLTLGAHEIKGGIDYSNNKIFNAFLQDTYGNYTFRCVNPSATYTYNSTFSAPLNCATSPAADIEKAILENFERGRPFTYQVQVPAAGKTLQDGVARWSIADTGFFLQDTWKLNKDITLIGGVRVDRQSVPDKPIANAAAAAPVVAGNAGTNTRQTGGFGLDNSQTIDGDELVQPRLGFNWKLDTADKRKQQLRGGIGLFQGAAATVWLSNPFSNTGVSTRIVGCGGSFAACPSAGGIFSADPANQPTSFPGTTPAANVDFIEKGMGQPAIWKMNLAFDTELPWYGLVAGAEWLRTDVRQALFYRHLNLGAVTKTGSDGRDMFYNANGYNTNCWTATGATNAGAAGCGGTVTAKALNNASFNNVLLASKTGQGGGDSVTLSLAQQPTRELSWSLAYTRATAKEVSPLTSSVANSNFNSRSVFNPNEEVAANSAYLIRDRIGGSVTWSKAFIGSYKTSVGLFYEGRTGHTYSWTYSNDLNGDGVAGNDLMYIPTAPGSGEVVFNGGAAEEAKFWDIVNANPQLANSKGKVVSRNGSTAPWVNNFDLRLSQELPGFWAQHKGQITLDILNFGNFLNKRWGRIDEYAFQSGGGAIRSFVAFKGLDSNGKYIYALQPQTPVTTRQVRGESQWAMQVTLKYEF